MYKKAILLALLIIMHTNAGAAQLDKFGNNYTAPSVQTVNIQREAAIKRAIAKISVASPQDKALMIAEYRKKAQDALSKGNDDAASFYTEILRRSGN